MSTRATVHFKYKDGDERTAAIVYRHSDGYPEGLGADLETFLDDVKKETKETQDTRFGDPSYLAAKFVVWQTLRYAKDGSIRGTLPLAQIGVGVCLEDPGDIEYRYSVLCGPGARPTILAEKV